MHDALLAYAFSYSGLTSLNGAFSNLGACGNLIINSNGGLRTFGTAFQNLQMINGQLQINGNTVSGPRVRLVYPRTAYSHARTSTHRHRHTHTHTATTYTLSSHIHASHLQNGGFTSMASAFPALRNVTGQLLIQNAYYITTMSGAFPRLMWVGGMLQLNQLQRLSTPTLFPALEYAGGVRLYAVGFAGSTWNMNRCIPKPTHPHATDTIIQTFCHGHCRRFL